MQYHQRKRRCFSMRQSPAYIMHLGYDALQKVCEKYEVIAMSILRMLITVGLLENKVRNAIYDAVLDRVKFKTQEIQSKLPEKLIPSYPADLWDLLLASSIYM